MNLVQRMKNLWQKSEMPNEIDPLVLLRVLYDDEQEVERRYNELLIRTNQKQVGDGQAVFMADGNEAEYEQYVHEEVHGWRPFMDKVRNLPRSWYGRTENKPTQAQDRQE